MLQQKRNGGSGAMGRYVLRHILRAPGKSLLCLVLAGAFMVGLMLIRVSTIRSENELEHLYTTTTVTAELIKNSLAPITRKGITYTGYVYPSIVDDLAGTGFLSHCYVEAATQADYLIRLDARGGVVDDRYTVGDVTLYGAEYSQEFQEHHADAGGEITYFDGWDESVFLQSWNDWQSEDTAKVYPAVVSQKLYETLQMEEGDLLRAGIAVDISGEPPKTTRVVTNLTVVGTHPGSFNMVLLPMESYREVAGTDPNYQRVILTIDPAKNHQLDEFRVRLSDLLPEGGVVPITAVYWDQELRQAIAPMEQGITLMKTLYPVTLALSLIVAAGISILLSLLSAKEAAILRVLGNSKARCRAILCLQNILPCFVGLVAGHLVAVVMAHVMLPTGDAAGLLLPALGRTGLYLISAVLGAAVASVAMTAKDPLELLQVKE